MQSLSHFAHDFKDNGFVDAARRLLVRAYTLTAAQHGFEMRILGFDKKTIVQQFPLVNLTSDLQTAGFVTNRFS